MTLSNMLQPILPEIILACTAFLLVLVGSYKKDSSKLVLKLAIAGLVISSYFLVVNFNTASNEAYQFFIVDGLSHFAKLLTNIVVIFVVIMGMYRLERGDKIRFEAPALILLATVGMMVMISANDLLSLYMGIELQSLSLYVLAAFNRDDERQSEAGLKYFMLGSLASGLLLYGCSLIYGFTGDTVLSSMSGMDHLSIGLLLGLILLLIGLFFKISAVPFQMWSPDVYHGVSKLVLTFFATAPKIAVAVVLYRLLDVVFEASKIQWEQIVIFVSLASMAVGAFAGLVQKNIKRLMAYSSIGHVGFVLMAIAVGSTESLSSLLIYITIYVFMGLGVFALILVMRKNNSSCEEIEDLSGIAKSNPVIAFCFTVMMFSMAGIPPLAGFFAKFYVLKAAIIEEYYIFASMAIIFSVVSAFYYLRIIKVIYFDELKSPLDILSNSKAKIVISVLIAANILFFLFPDVLLSVIDVVSRNLAT